jgi:hypothetical protein
MPGGAKRILKTGAVLAALLSAAGIAAAQDAPAPPATPGAPVIPTPAPGAHIMTEEEIRRDVANASISGRYTFGGFFTEFHLPDGRVLGHNGWTRNTDACWSTKPSQICYSYGPPDDRQTYCFTMERNGDNLTLRTAEEGRLNGIAKLEPGNPRNHTDGGVAWTCDAIVSEAPGARTRFAAR